MQGRAFKNDSEDPMSEVLSEFINYEVTAIIHVDWPGRETAATGVLTWIDSDDEYQLGDVQFREKDVKVLIVFE